MLLILLTLTLSLIFFTVFIPCVRAQRIRAARRSEEYFRLVKLSSVRDYYPEFQNLSFREIAVRYDYDDAYWKMR